MDSNHLSPLRKGVVGVQFLFVAFGATVLVPLLVGLDPSLIYGRYRYTSFSFGNKGESSYLPGQQLCVYCSHY